MFLRELWTIEFCRLKKASMIQKIHTNKTREECEDTAEVHLLFCTKSHLGIPKCHLSIIKCHFTAPK